MDKSKFSLKFDESENQQLLGGLLFGVVVSLVSELLLTNMLVDGAINFNLGRALISSVALVTGYVFIFSIYRGKIRLRDLLTLSCVVISQVLLLCLGQPLALGLSEASESWSVFVDFQSSSVYYGLPIASGAMLLQLVLGLQYALICSFSLAYLSALYLPLGQLMFVHVLATSAVGCFCLRNVRSRSGYSRAGLHIFFMSVLLIIFWGLHSKVSNVDFLVQIVSALVGAILAFLIVSGFSPLLELLGGYVSDLRLIEMATLDHPLLKELSVQAPGTWNHSMVMGMMAEAAADAIGANAVLAKVGSYFHDIGKSRKPLYFVENQFGGENRHDKLSPSMSALIIRSHVKDGLEMARRCSLPESLQDMISQHHGTSTIHFFYDKALKEAGNQEDGVEVDITHYQYPGPRPQTREAGILMLADGIEAASRTMQEPTFDRIQGMVQKLINKVFASGQLDECDLTLQDLHKIARCFTRVLAGIHHQRVAYSEPVEKGAVRVKEKEDLGAQDDSRKENAVNVGVPVDDKIQGENLKRLGVE